jgi:hypothetical protein
MKTATRIKTLRVVKAGAYTAIIAILGPQNASPGAQVFISVAIKNTFVATINVACVAFANGQRIIDTSGDNNWLNPDQRVDFYQNPITMPDGNLVVDAYSYFQDTNGLWQPDDHMQITITPTPAAWNKLTLTLVNVSIQPTAAWQKLTSQNVNVALQPTAGWQKLTSQNVNVALQPTAGWQKLTSQNVNVGLQPTAGWQKLTSQNVNVGLQPIGGWQKLQQKQVEVGISATGGWQKLGTKQVSVKQGFEIPAGYTKVLDQTTDAGKKYSGPAQRSVSSWSFLPASFPGAMWFTKTFFLNKLAGEVQKQGQQLLDMQLYENGTAYFLVMETTNTATGYRPYAQAVIAAIIIAALILAIVITLIVLVHIVTDFVYKSPGAAISIGLILLGVAGAGVLGLAIWKGTSVKQAITGKAPAPKQTTKALATAPKKA